MSMHLFIRMRGGAWPQVDGLSVVVIRRPVLLIVAARVREMLCRHLAPNHERRGGAASVPTTITTTTTLACRADIACRHPAITRRCVVACVS